MSNESGVPYKALGDRLKFLREQWQQTLREVSLTLEIEQSTLEAIEDGKALPNHEVLDMLISHFLLTDDQADDLRELADMGQDKSSDFPIPVGLEDMLTKQLIMYLPVDNKVVYTDAMHANVNDHGVILQFMQQLPNTSQPAVVSRVGMSREHAEKVIEVLRQTLNQHDLSKKSKRTLQAPDSENKSQKNDA
jgi:DNA-binding XRE family transcriptional regulator